MFTKKQEDMIARSLFTESKKLRVFDFDDTLVKTTSFIYVTNNVPLPTGVLPYNDMRVNITGLALVNGLIVRSTTSGMQQMSYNVSTEDVQNDCLPKSAIWGVYATVSPLDRTTMSKTPIKVTFPVAIISPKKIVNGKVVRLLVGYSTRSHIVKDGSLDTKVVI